MEEMSSSRNLRLRRPPRRVHTQEMPARSTTSAAQKTGRSPESRRAKAVPLPESAPAANDEPPRATVDVHALSQKIRHDLEIEYAEKWRMAAALIDEATTLKQNALQQAESTVLRLAFEMARKIVHCEPSVNPEACMATVRQALRLLRETESLTIVMHPDDLKLLEQNEQIKRELEAKTPQLKLKPRQDLARGGCVLENETGVIDARIESQLAELESLLIETVS
jgi:hypothetical protein